MESKRTLSLPTVGIGSLLTVFAALCLTVFALLSVTTVQADCRLSEKSMAAATGYYEADCRAEEILAQLREGLMPEGVTEEDGIYRYSCAISETQALAVRVKVDGEQFEVLQWQTVSTVNWQANDKIPVWEGVSS